jgi:hypothetical protein
VIQNINLGLRFILELCALGAVVYWGFHTGDSWWVKLGLGILLPVLMAAAWGTFRVPNDPGPAPVAIPGALRLLLEFGVFAIATFALANAGRPTLAWVFAIVTILNYAMLYPRLVWLLTGK